MRVNSEYKVPLAMKICAIYVILVTIVVLIQIILQGSNFFNIFSLRVVVFLVLLLMGFCIIPIWKFFSNYLPIVLICWWLPQLIKVTNTQYLDNGSVHSVNIWDVGMLFSFSVNFGYEMSPSVYQLYHLNILAGLSLIYLIYEYRKAKTA